METKCKICGEVFTNNKGGQFTNHILKEHGLTLEEYVVEYELNGVAPKCACGLCDERPVFRRGSFSAYALNHRKFDVRQELWIKKYGNPVCKNPSCSNQVSFHRGSPQTYCSQKCNEGSFGREDVQQKVQQTIQRKYGVKNISHLDETKRKLSIAATGRKRAPFTAAHKAKLGASSKKNWENIEYRNKIILSMKNSINGNPEEIARRSQWMRDKMQEEDFIQKVHDGFTNRFSKLHLKVRECLQMDALGFIGEQRVGRYFVDEVNEEYKVIVEINGDYVHANPRIYNPEDIIRLRGNSYTAEEKWESDEKKHCNLKKMGYNVITVWESDDLDKKLEEIKKLLTLDINRAIVKHTVKQQGEYYD
jgi:very-short-patch-repair endonuclease